MDGTQAATIIDASAVRFCLDEDQVARIVIDQTATVLWRSRAAAAMLSGPSPLVDRGGKIGGADRRTHQFLMERMAEALAGHEVCQFIENEDQDRRFLLRMRVVEDADDRAIVIVLKDFDAPAHLPRLEALFGLSIMEARILAEIIAGHSADRIAELKGVSILTVRTHIKHIHGKMGVRSKEEILATMVKIIA
ncbi:helix-turn-helix transcriptional regulator [Caulobacter endophyticus]|uniref:helix-turn-helix transcriptional regulator n=1 Tax=Caulobacter endophyticus TaxID=2172652 RepID=UPI0024108BE1|nr:helix-turn-helix transcriptional regulator [Caulobacter endophyticus]MDG2529049.1 helix-turn-helix transcriptional regulator [Caulobacter endophyticus]